MSKNNENKSHMIIAGICAAGLISVAFLFFRKKPQKKEKSFYLTDESTAEQKRQQNFKIMKIENLNFKPIIVAIIPRFDDVKIINSEKLTLMRVSGQNFELNDVKSEANSNISPKTLFNKSDNLNYRMNSKKEKFFSRKSLIQDKDRGLVPKIPITKNQKLNIVLNRSIPDFESERKKNLIEENREIQLENNNYLNEKSSESDGYRNDNEDLTEQNESITGDFSVNSIKNSKILIQKENNKQIQKKAEKLRQILRGKATFDDEFSNLSLVDKVLKEGEKISVIDENQLLVILNYLYKEIHHELIELSDTFIEERRKFFKKDHETYINIINYFLKKKEEFFLCVLSDLMSKLEISQKILDNTFYYFINVADESDTQIQLIKQSYDKVYHAGIRNLNPPKNLDKEQLKKVLNFHCETYENLLKKYTNYEPEVIDIISRDYVYLEFGLDREAIKSAIATYDFGEDFEFDRIVEKLENYQNSSFISI